MPYKNPEDRRAHDRANAAKRRESERERYANDEEYRERIKEKRRENYEANRGKKKAQSREYRSTRKVQVFRTYLKSRYGLSLDGWHLLLVGQAGRCAICSDPMHDPHVDHCHATGRIRGLLCTNCNTGLGKFRDDPNLLMSAMSYLGLRLPYQI